MFDDSAVMKLGNPGNHHVGICKTPPEFMLICLCFRNQFHWKSTLTQPLFVPYSLMNPCTSCMRYSEWHRCSSLSLELSIQNQVCTSYAIGSWYMTPMSLDLGICPLCHWILVYAPYVTGSWYMPPMTLDLGVCTLCHWILVYAPIPLDLGICCLCHWILVYAPIPLDLGIYLVMCGWIQFLR